MRVLLPRGGTWASEVTERLRESGHEAVVVPLVRVEPAADQRAFGEVRDQIAAGAFEWLVVTSPNAVKALPIVPFSTKIAAVGNVAAQAVRERGLPVAFIPRRQSAEGLADEWPAREGTVAWPHAADSSPTLRQALEAKGMRVTDVIAYQTIPLVDAPGDLTDPDPSDDATETRIRQTPEQQAASLDEQWSPHEALSAVEPSDSPFDAVLLTSPSVAKLVSALGLPEATIVVAADPRTERTAVRRGLTVHAVAKDAQPASLVQALELAQASGSARA